MKKLLIYVHGFGGGKCESKLGKAIQHTFFTAKNIDLWMPRWGGGDPKISAWKTALDLLEKTIKHGLPGTAEEIMRLFAGGQILKKPFLTPKQWEEYSELY